MHRRATSSLALSTTVAVLLSSPGTAQSYSVAPSGRASTTVTLSPTPEARRVGATQARLSIDYGQPHARGRAVAGALSGDLDHVWRLGANEATAFHADLDVVIGTLTVPKGDYTLFSQTSRKGEWQLIVSRKTGEWGLDYDPSMDLGRVPLRSRTLASPVEAFSIWLVPAGDGSARGELRIAWGTREFAVDWRVK